MRRPTTRRTGIGLLACSLPLSLLLPTCTRAQDALNGQKWSVEAGAGLVQMGPEGIHIDQPDAGGLTYHGIASAPVTLPTGRSWRVTFDFKFGQLRSAGSAVCLLAGEKAVGWVGADGWYKREGCFVGKDNEVASPPADAAWHTFTLSGDGTNVTVAEDGKVIGSGPQGGTPDSIRVGDVWGPSQPPGAVPTKTPDGQQTELWLRNVRIGTATAIPPAEKPAQAADAIPPGKPLEASQGVPQPASDAKQTVLVKSVTIKYIYGMAGVVTVGTLSQVPGIWQMTVTLQNTTDQAVWLIPTMLEFDNGSTENILPIDGWHSAQDSRHVSGDGWGVNMRAEYFTPTPSPSPYIGLGPKETLDFDVFCENGGAWTYVTQQRANGSTSYPQQTPRNPRQLTFLRLPDSADPNKPTLEARMASPFGFSPLPTEPYARNIELLRRVPRPPVSDARWVVIPLTRIKPEVPDTSHF